MKMLDNHSLSILLETQKTTLCNSCILTELCYSHLPPVQIDKCYFCKSKICIQCTPEVTSNYKRLHRPKFIEGIGGFYVGFIKWIYVCSEEECQKKWIPLSKLVEDNDDDNW